MENKKENKKRKISSITEKEILSIKGYQLQNITRENLYPYVRQAVTMAKRYVTNYKKQIKAEPDMVKSIAFKEWNDEYKNRRRYKGYLDFEYKIDDKMTVQQLKHQFKMARNLLATKTHTKEGKMKVLTEFVNRLNDKAGSDINVNTLTQTQISNLWTIYKKANELIGYDTKIQREYYSSTQAQRDIYSMIVDKPLLDDDNDRDIIEKLALIIQEREKKAYEEFQRNNEDDNDSFSYKGH